MPCRSAQHPLKMLGIEFSCGSYQTTSEQIMVLNSWYQTLFSNLYLFVDWKSMDIIYSHVIFLHTLGSVGKVADSWSKGWWLESWPYRLSGPGMGNKGHSTRLMPLVCLATMRTCTECDAHKNANIIPIVIPVPLSNRWLVLEVLQQDHWRYKHDTP